MSRTSAETESLEADKMRVLLASIVDTSEDAIIAKSLEGRILSWNRAAERIFGYRAEEVLDKPITLILPPERLTEEEAILNRLRKGETVRHLETVRVTKAGQRIDVSLTVSPLVDQGGRVVGASKILRDITKEKRASDALKESEERFVTIFRSSPIPADISRLDSGQFIEINDAFLTLYGYQRHEVIGHTSTELGMRVKPEQWRELLERVKRDGKARAFEVEFRTRLGKTGVLLLSAERVEIGGEPHLFTIGLDYTERKLLEERSRVSQKMEAIGQIAGGMAHEFNNILAAMMMNLSLVQMAQLSPETQETLGEMHELSRKAAEIVKQLLAFSRQSVMCLESLDWAAVISRQVEMLRHFLGDNIRVEFSAPQDLPRIYGDRMLLEQALLNLCLNARDAMTKGGWLKLSLEERHVGPEQATQRGDCGAGRYVVLSVQDSGCGMRDITLKRLFEPFYTTKGVGKGTGLGLSTVKGIVEQIQGWVEVESQLGQGSTFRIYLPANQETPTKPDVPLDGVIPLKQMGTVLYVEDEVLLRKPTSKALQAKGYVVLETDNSREAMGVWEIHRHEIDLLYSDLVMPGELTGLQLAEKFLAEKPELKVILTSGYNTDLPNEADLASRPITFLPKPCSLEIIVEAIGKMLKKSHKSHESVKS